MLYAAYGSNLHPVRLSLRLPASRFLGTAAICGRRLCFHKRSNDESAKCSIARGTGRVHVALYELTGREKMKLDEIEGVGFGYDLESVQVPGFGEAFTYVASTSHVDDGRRPYSWYKELVLVGCEALNFPVPYVSMIRRISAIVDPDASRHAKNMRIVQQARIATIAISRD